MEPKIWAVIPPIILDPVSLHFNLIVSETAIKALYKFLARQATSYEVLAIENIKRLNFNFTHRQSEITKFAV
ncbi:MAG: hypothetical protein ACOC44_07880 [Promethearchaeia archaeon]